MKIKITRNTAISGDPIKAGEVIDVDPGVYRVLKAANKAEIYEEPPKKAQAKKGK